MGNVTDHNLIENIKALKDTIEQMFPRACQNEDSLYDTCLLLEDLLAQYKTELKAEKEKQSRLDAILTNDEFQGLSYEQRTEYLKSTDCSNSRLRFTVTKENRDRGYINMNSSIQLRRTFRDCGLVILQKVYSQELLEELKAEQEKYFNKWYTKNIVNTTKSETRGKDRFEVWAPMIPPFTSEEFLATPFLLPVIRALLNEKRLEINMLSSVTSLAGASTQHWHRDAGPLFTLEDFPHPLPAYGVVMFVALVDLVKQNGPTEFLLKSHHQCRKKDISDHDLKDG